MAVRNESVRLSLQDDFSTGMARAAAMTALLNKELNSLSGQSVQTARVSQNINRDTDAMAKSAQRADKGINQLTGRLRLLADVAAILGPSLAPIGAVGIAGLAGLANQFGAAALAGGTAILAFQGVGDALKAVNEAGIEPTAANLEKARLAMAQLSPVARQMVDRLDEMRPAMQRLRDMAAAGLFPGLMRALDDLETRIPDVERVLVNVGDALGDVVAAGAEGLASNRWDDFFNFLATEVPDTLQSLGETVGSLTHGMAELWMAFDPLSDDFSGWLQDIASGFDEWAAGLAQTDGFREFVDYVRTNGPQVADTFAALGDAIVQIVQASAPLGGPVLAGLEAVANVISAIADSDLGTPIMTSIASLALLSRATSAYGALATSTWGSKVGGALSGYASELLHVTTAQERAQTSAKSLDGATKSLNSTLIGIGAAAAGVAVLGTALDSWDDASLSASAMEVALRQLANGEAAAGLNDLSWSAETLGEALQEAAWADLDFGTATDEIEELDKALASMDAETAADAFAAIAEQGKAAGLSMAEINGLFPEYLAAQELRAEQDREAAIAAAAADAATRNHGRAVGMFAGAADEAADAAQRFSAELAILAGFFDKRAAIRGYESAIDEFRKGLKATGNSFDINNKKGRENQERLDAIGTSAIQVAENLKGIRKAEYVGKVVGDLKKMQGELKGPARAAIQEVIDRLREVAKQKPSPKVQLVGEAETNAALRGILREMDALDGKTSTVRIYEDTYQRVYRVPGGGRIPVATGGYISGPGTATSDSIPANLSNGEYVIQAAAVARYGRETFDRLNAMNFASGGYVAPVRMAGGGPVSVSTGPLSATVSLSDTDVQRIAAAVAEGARIGTSESFSNDSSFRGVLASQGVR